MSASSSSAAAAPEVLPEPLGPAPHVRVKVLPAPGMGLPSQRYPNGLQAEVSLAAPLEELRASVAEGLRLPAHGVLFLAQGASLDPSRSLKDNNITLPGPAARRRGEGVELFFDVSAEVIDRERRTAAMAEAMKKKDEEKRRQEQVFAERRQQEEDDRRRRQDEAAQAAASSEVELATWAQRTLGVDRDMRQTLLQDPVRLEEWEQQRVGVQQHYLEPCGEDVVGAIQRLLSSSGYGGPMETVLRVYRNHNDTLERRYTHAKRLLMEGGGIPQQPIKMQSLCQGDPPLDFLGPYERSVNEYPMWHGTPSAEAAGGICEIGFDVARCGQHGLVWGRGFYFADSASVSARYLKPQQINSTYRDACVLILCRVLGGRVKNLSNPPTEEEKMAHTAECLGKGGTFGAEGSKFHSIKGADYAWVSLHRDQVYPAYVIVCGTKRTVQ